MEPEAILHYAQLFWIDALNRPVEGENPDWVWSWEEFWEFFQRFKLANYKRRAKRAACLALLDALTQKSERNGLSGA